MAELIIPEQVKELFSYDFSTGQLRWKINPSRRAKIGDIAGCGNPEGYVRTWFKGKCYKNHRLVFAWHNSIWPSDEIDNINGIRNDNRIENLREVGRVQNSKNLRLRVDNKSGHHGISWKKANRKWRPQ